MKNILIFLILNLSLLTSCNDNDSEVRMDYNMPYITSDKNALKTHLLKITPNVTESQDGNTFTIVCKPPITDTNMFYELIYVYNYKGFDLDEFTFTYKIDKSISLTEENKTKLAHFLKNSIIEL